ncbi:MAG: Dihydroorotate dehydrogenase (NAD(+)), electron transfer subunit, partial [uncultured Rubrobacteraceae bacterium]
EVLHGRDRSPPRARRLHPYQLPLAGGEGRARPVRDGPRGRLPGNPRPVPGPTVLLLRLRGRGGEPPLRGPGPRHGAAGPGDTDGRGNRPAWQGIRDRRLRRAGRAPRRGHRGRATQDPGQRALRPRHRPRRVPGLSRRGDGRRRRRLCRRLRRHDGRVRGHPRHGARRRAGSVGVSGRLRLRSERDAGRRQGRRGAGRAAAALRGGADGLRERFVQRLRGARGRGVRAVLRRGTGLPRGGAGVV